MSDFNAKIRDHLTKQRARAYDHEAQMCCYRTGDGKMCAVGCLIPVEAYRPQFEGLTVCQVRNGIGGLATIIGAEAALEQEERYANLKHALPEGLDFESAIAWQAYHDNTWTLENTQYSYGRWADKSDPAHSPAAFHDALIKHLADKAEVQGE